MIERSSRIRSLCMLPAAGLISLTFLLPQAALAADPACEPMFTAITKLLQTPNHQYMSQSSATEALTHGGKLRNSESISTSESSYIRVDNQWHKVPITAQEMLKQEEASHQNSKEVCHQLDDDASEDNAAVYNSHSETDKGKSDVKIWISKTNGLPVREEIDLDLGGDTGKTHSSVRFDYDHVDPPKDAK